MSVDTAARNLAVHLRGHPAPVEVSHAYRLRLSLVLIALALLQGLYLALIVAVVWLGWNGTVLLSGFWSNGFAAFLVLMPAAAALVATTFLLKPLVIRPPRPPGLLQLNSESEPELFSFVAKLCDVLRAPRPGRIFGDLRVNASASVHGWHGFFLGKPDLTIGLPIAAGLTLPQFTGVLAHEFGHFAQRAGLRSSYLIASIQNWFARVVNQRDHLDDWLEHRKRGGDWRLRLIAMVAAGTVHCSRRYLEVLRKAAEHVSASFSRQLEFDADRHETSIVGAKVFEETLARVSLLNAGLLVAWRDANESLRVGRLPDDIAALTAARVDWLTEETITAIRERDAAQRSGRLDTHPGNAERLASVQVVELPGIFTGEGSAALLFSDLPALGRAATHHHYEKLDRIPPANYVLASFDAAIESGRNGYILDRCCQDIIGAPAAECIRWFRVADLPECPEPPGEINGEAEPLQMGDLEKVREKHRLRYAALILAQNGVPVNMDSFQVTGQDTLALTRDEAKTRGELNIWADRLRKQTSPMAETIAAVYACATSGEYHLTVRHDRLLGVFDLKTACACHRFFVDAEPQIFAVELDLFASRIVRANAHRVPAARCANLLDDLEEGALRTIRKIVAAAEPVPAFRVVDPRRAAILGAQLDPGGNSRADQIETFLARAREQAAGALGELCWWALAFRSGTDDQAAP